MLGTVEGKDHQSQTAKHERHRFDGDPIQNKPERISLAILTTGPPTEIEDEDR